MLPSSRFSPQTREGQCDEQWAFVGKKPQPCDPDEPADTTPGDTWAHVACAPVHRLGVSVVPGQRTAEQTEALVKALPARPGGRMMALLVSDASPAYKTAMLHT